MLLWIFESHPARVRGLKQKWMERNARCGVSHPARVRGLKHPRISPLDGCLLVAPRAGAWIETNTAKKEVTIGEVAPRAGAWIETPVMHRATGGALCRTPRGCVD